MTASFFVHNRHLRLQSLYPEFRFTSITMSSTSVTTTINGIIDVAEETKHFMLPGMAAPEHLSIDAGTRVVRFDKQCVLIPQTPKQKRPMVVTRSYTLPLWKRRGRQSDFETAEEPTGPSATPPSPENTRIIIKVPIPTLVLTLYSNGKIHP